MSRTNLSRKLAPYLGISGLYFILLATIFFLIEFKYISNLIGVLITVAIVLLQFIVGPLVMDWSLQLFGELRWVQLHELPSHLQKFILECCSRHSISVPRIGIVSDGSPQAYTYGTIPNSARLVLTQGMLGVLEPEELEAVVAHEFGHIVRWDFVIMTLAQIVPVVLYQLYRQFYELMTREDEETGKSGFDKRFLLVVVSLYVGYQLSNLIVLFISRSREYSADEFSVLTTGNPVALMNALSKISYGIEALDLDDSGQKMQSNLRKQMAVQALGIMSVADSKEASFYSSLEPQATSEDLKQVMRWDLQSPWASYFELLSTHPLIAKRLTNIIEVAKEIEVEVDFDLDYGNQSISWFDFLFDVFILALPFIGAAAGFFKSINFDLGSVEKVSLWLILYKVSLGLCVGGLIRFLFQYPFGSFQNRSIVSLLKKVDVSPVSSLPVRLTGSIIGRGEAGNRFSEDMIFRDQSGMIFLDYEHILSNWYFAFFKFERFMGSEFEVVVEGWYRRGPLPYIEVSRIVSKWDTTSTYVQFRQLLKWISAPAILWLLFRYGFVS